MSNGKPGPVTIPVEVWKTNVLHQQLLEVCNKALNKDTPQI